MTQTEVIEKVGKKSFFSDNTTLAGILDYKKGIEEFDTHLNGKSLEDIKAVIHLSIYPKGVVIKIVKTLSSVTYATSFEEIECCYVLTEGSQKQFIIERPGDNNIVFSLRNNSEKEALDFFESYNKLKFCDYNKRLKSKNGKATSDNETETVLITHYDYAEFWKRAVAWFIDYAMFSILGSIVWYVLKLPIPEHVTPIFGGTWVIFTNPLGIIIGWLYFALMESSEKQATLGKMAVKIKVTDMSGNRISFGKATGRYFGKIISGLILGIGYFMAGFTPQKQALHDKMANCLVLNETTLEQTNK